MTKRTYERYLKLIKSRHWTETDIIAFRKLLLSCMRWSSAEACFDGRTRLQVANELLERFRNAGPHRITREQSDKGLNWLKTVCFTSRGQIRNSKTRPFEYWDCQLLAKMLPKFSYWTFDDVHEITNDYGCLNGFAPVYTLHTRDKREFTYVAHPMGYHRGCEVLYAGGAL